MEKAHPPAAAEEVPAVFAFNGDADGLIAQHLLEMEVVRPALRITGLKRDIDLLRRLPDLDAARLFVCDITLEANREALQSLLARPGITVRWFDHHHAGTIPGHPRLETHIHPAPDTCTALIVHRFLGFPDPRWAAAAAFGDNLPGTALALMPPETSREEIEALRELGELLNYNAYGETPADVLFQPLDVAGKLSPFRDPMAFFRDSGLFPPLREQFRVDQQRAAGLGPKEQKGSARIFHLPSEPWARRLGSTFANLEALREPESALAILHPLVSGWRVSIRAPRLPGAVPASDLAREFPTGGGRPRAAGINTLPDADLERFHHRFFETYA